MGKGLSAMGLMPALLSGAAGKENRGFGLGILPGMIYKDQYNDKERERQAQEAAAAEQAAAEQAAGMKKGGKVRAKKKYVSGGTVKSSASKRADGCAQRGKTKGRMV